MKIRSLTVLLASTLLLASLCKAQTTTGTPELPSSAIIKQTTGDLDKDSVNETVAIYDISTGKDNLGVTRIMAIYKNRNGKATLWKKAIIDQMENVNSPRNKDIDTLYIARNCIILKQTAFLGGRNSTNYTHIFRFQNNDWYLIGSRLGYVTNCYGANICEINFSTGIINISFVPDGGCEEEPAQYTTLKKKQQSYTHKFEQIPLLDGLAIGENNFTITDKKINCQY